MKILTYLETDLTVPSVPVEKFPLDAQIVEKMVYQMRKQRGVGLAAPQVGIRERFFVLNRFGQQVIANPRILTFIPETELGKEGCLSFPWIDVEVPRYPSVRVSYQDERGKEHVESFTGFLARTVQHEIAHLDGKGIWDYLK